MPQKNKKNLLSFLIQNCLHSPNGDHKIDVSAEDLKKEDPAQVSFLKSRGLLIQGTFPKHLICNHCGRTCSLEIIRNHGNYFVLCEEEMSRRSLDTKELERWTLSLEGMGKFVSKALDCQFRGDAVEGGIAVCSWKGHQLQIKEKAGVWWCSFGMAETPLCELFYWQGRAFVLNKLKLLETFAGLFEYETPEKKWTDEKLLDLLERYAKLKALGIHAHTKVLADEVGVSLTQIKRLLKKAREINDSGSRSKR